jgi:hypothetical protein
MWLPLHQIQRKPFVVQHNFDCNPQIQQEDPVIMNKIKKKKYIM